MAKHKILLFFIGAISGLLLIAFFIVKFEAKEPSYHRIKKAILLSYIPPLEYLGEKEYLTQVSLLQPKIFDETDYMDSYRDLESFSPIIDTVIYIPNRYRFKLRTKD